MGSSYVVPGLGKLNRLFVLLGDDFSAGGCADSRKLIAYNQTTNAVLLDVRTPQEYREGHVPGSRNLPLQSIDQAAGVIKDKSTPLFVYCYSGSRSSQAVSRLMKMGYQNVKNIGGMASYSGKVEL